MAGVIAGIDAIDNRDFPAKEKIPERLMTAI